MESLLVGDILFRRTRHKVSSIRGTLAKEKAMNPQDAIFWGYVTLVFLTVWSLAGSAGGAVVLFESRKVWGRLNLYTKGTFWFHLVLVVGSITASIFYISVWLGEPLEVTGQFLFFIVTTSVVALPSAFVLNRELTIATKISEEK